MIDTAPPLPPDGRWATAFQVLIAHEGGLVNDPADPGGITNWGVSLRFAQACGDLDGDGRLDLDFDGDGDVDADDIRRMRRADAERVYRLYWWDRHRYGEFDLPIAIKLLDLSVNVGPAQAHKIAQRAARAHGQALAEDGVLGPKSRVALTLVGRQIIPAIRSEAAGFYRGLVAVRAQSAKHLAGWLNRAYS